MTVLPISRRRSSVLIQALVIALMEANRWLVQNVQDTHEAGADLRCQANALGLASGKRRRGTIEGQIVESDIDQKTQALQDFLDDASADKLLALGEFQALKNSSDSRHDRQQTS